MWNGSFGPRFPVTFSGREAVRHVCGAYGRGPLGKHVACLEACTTARFEAKAATGKGRKSGGSGVHRRRGLLEPGLTRHRPRRGRRSGAPTTASSSPISPLERPRRSMRMSTASAERPSVSFSAELVTYRRGSDAPKTARQPQPAPLFHCDGSLPTPDRACEKPPQRRPYRRFNPPKAQRRASSRAKDDLAIIARTIFTSLLRAPARRFR